MGTSSCEERTCPRAGPPGRCPCHWHHDDRDRASDRRGIPRLPRGAEACLGDGTEGRVHHACQCMPCDSESCQWVHRRAGATTSTNCDRVHVWHSIVVPNSTTNAVRQLTSVPPLRPLDVHMCCLLHCLEPTALLRSRVRSEGVHAPERAP